MLADLSDHFIFVIDTDTYAGNFEREMTAFCTGCTGECGVGERYAEMFLAEHGPDMADDFRNLVAWYPDDHGVGRPAAIWPTPGFWNDGMGDEYPDSAFGTSEVIEKYQAKIREHKAKYPASTIGSNGEPSKHPAYLSVAIFFHKEPSLEVLKLLCERAIAYKEYEGKPNKILGFRLIKPVLIEKSVWQANPEGKPVGAHHVV